MNQFPFGAAFLMPSKEIAKDLATMKDHGMNVARLEWGRNGVWESVEQAPGVFSFDILDEAMEGARAAGIKLIVHVGIYPPRWVREMYGGEGVVSDRGAASWPRELLGFCYDNPEIRQLADGFIRTLVRRYRMHPALYGWISWNEPRASRGDITCYCPHTIRSFQLWLQQVYGDLASLNRAWGEGYPAYREWDEVKPPRLRPRIRGIYQAWQDWRSFMDENFASTLRWVSNVIREEDNLHPTKVNLLIPVYNTTVTCADLWSMADTADEMGVSLFTDINEEIYPQLASQSADMIRSAARYHDGRFWLDEVQGGPNFVTHRRPFLPPDRLISLYPWQAIAHGAKGVTYWMWRPTAVGLEAGEFGLVGKDGSPRARTKVAARTAEVLQRHGELLLSLKPRNRVCILHSPAISHLAFGEELDTNQGSIPIDGGFSEKSRYTSSLIGAYTLLWEEKIGIDFINPEHIAARGLNGYSVLVMPFAYLMNTHTGLAVRRFVEGGGLVISEFPNLMKDESGNLYQTSPGGGLREAFGFEEHDLGHTGSGTISVADCGEIGIGRIRQIVCADSNADIVGRFRDGHPAVIFNRYGQGGILSFCTEIFQPVLSGPHYALSDLVKKYLRCYGVKGVGGLCGVDPEMARKVEITELWAPRGKVVFVINHNTEPVAGSLCLERWNRCMELISEKEVTLKQGQMDIRLEEFGVLALHCLD